MGKNKNKPKTTPEHVDERLLDDAERAIANKRGALYGGVSHGHTCLGKMWTAILENHFQMKLPHDIPAHVALLMMTALKIERAATSTNQPDTYIDGALYFKLAGQAHNAERKSDDGKSDKKSPKSDR